MKELQQAYQSSVTLQFCRFYKELHAILGRGLITTPQTTVDASEELKSQTPAMNSEEEKYGGHVTGGSTYAMSQDLVLTPPQSTQSQQSSTGEPDTREETLAVATAALRVSLPTECLIQIGRERRRLGMPCLARSCKLVLHQTMDRGPGG
ncbi:small integral membrane protein 14 isoform X1 [Gopherus flavomarginatus]|uniref:small integral membrane protein 14 isoform X1 n=1 Tax=Gopherus flavomarginatus TaxID=286002 RepID=UPI0021CC4C00|nr:small integral membrane protein 14 isoform X1 [Gopherus flavomarginatus]